MPKFQLTNKAVENLNGISNYTFDEQSETQADRYTNQLIQFCQDIANNPNIGKNHDGVTKDLFGLKANKHIIFYRVLKNKPIEITRILHCRMDLKNTLKE